MNRPIITISFLRSSSPRFPFALAEAQKQPSFRQDNNSYSVSFEDPAALHRLLDHLKGMRHRHVYVDDQEMPWDEVFHYLWCYRLRQKAYDPIQYCLGDSRQYPAINPWGCIQALMPLSNNIEWLRYGQFDKDGTWIFDKKKIAHYLNINTHQHRFCPALDMNTMIRILGAFPETANPKIDKDWVYADVYDLNLTVGMSISNVTCGQKQYCGVRPASPQSTTNICKKILAKLQ